MRRSRRCRLGFALCAAALLTAAVASSAAGSVTIGQVPPQPGGFTCNGPAENVQPTVTSGASYVVPPSGAKITSWSTLANSNTNQLLGMKVFRPLSGLSYQVVGHSGPFPLTPSQINTFATDLAVQPGDVLGLGAPAGSSNTACVFGVSSTDERLLMSGADTADGSSITFMAINGLRSNISAQVALKASNEISLGKLKRNKRRGTATLAVEVPGPGNLTLTGTGVKRQRPLIASASKAVSAAGTVKLRVKAKGKKKRKVNDRGRVKVKVKVAFAPNSEVAVAPGTASKRVKLVKRG